MQNRRAKRGQQLVEMALTLPIFIMVIIGIIDFGRALHCWSNLNYQCVQAARAAGKRIHPLIARNVFSKDTHPALEVVQEAFWKNRSPMMPEASYSNLEFKGVGNNTGVGIAKETVEIKASFNMSLMTPFIGALVGGTNRDGAITISSIVTERKE
ncbi:MAG TPA: TadE/TadG family type IV pilus assembly protein [Candidatus Rifleibacterium sp.]|nr:TadE/TadG family type IV pilus assembly protein [Candidatus Rifleibacterium sp.]HPT46539.1 TadE/TadG family type IV pilus assembly protein [Candidatus Rifleibacterium sp.]